MRNESRWLVASAWHSGMARQGANVFTDGADVFSYRHKVGETDPETQKKTAYDCHYSVTTAKHCSAFKTVADRVVPCPSCASGNNAPAKG